MRGSIRPRLVSAHCRLGEVESERWAHLAVVKSQGSVSGWLNGKRQTELNKTLGPNFHDALGIAMIAEPNHEIICVANEENGRRPLQPSSAEH